MVTGRGIIQAMDLVMVRYKWSIHESGHGTGHGPGHGLSYGSRNTSGHESVHGSGTESVHGSGTESVHGSSHGCNAMPSYHQYCLFRHIRAQRFAFSWPGKTSQVDTPS